MADSSKSTSNSVQDIKSLYQKMKTSSNQDININEDTPPDLNEVFRKDCDALDRDCRVKGILILFCDSEFITACQNSKFSSRIVNGDMFLNENTSVYIEGDNIRQEIINVWLKIINEVGSNVIVLSSLIAYAPAVYAGTRRHDIWDKIIPDNHVKYHIEEMTDIDEISLPNSPYYKHDIMTNIQNKFRLRAKASMRGLELSPTHNEIGYPGFMDITPPSDDSVKYIYKRDDFNCPSVICPLSSQNIKSEHLEQYKLWSHSVRGIPYDSFEDLYRHVPKNREHITINTPHISEKDINSHTVAGKLSGNPDVLISVWKNIINLMNVGSPLVICGTEASFPPSTLKRYNTEVVYNACHQQPKIEMFKKYKISFAVMYDEKDIRLVQSWGCVVVPCAEKLKYLNNNIRSINKLPKETNISFDNVKIQHANIKQAILREFFSYNVPIYKPCPLIDLILNVKGKTKVEGPSPKGHQPETIVDP